MVIKQKIHAALSYIYWNFRSKCHKMVDYVFCQTLLLSCGPGQKGVQERRRSRWEMRFRREKQVQAGNEVQERKVGSGEKGVQKRSRSRRERRIQVRYGVRDRKVIQEGKWVQERNRVQERKWVQERNRIQDRKVVQERKGIQVRKGVSVHC